MTLLPIYKICPVCRRRYLWNPDVGRINCPNCSGIGETGSKVARKILRSVMKNRKG